MTPPTIFFTGFPGFLGAELLPRVLSRDPSAEAICLVQQRFMAAAEERIEQFEAASPDLAGRTRLVVGDITRDDLGLGSQYQETASATTSVYHLAAVYDLSVSQEVGMAVNVAGTRNVCDFAASCSDLERLHYVSTCYVSGRFAGIFREDDLAKPGQLFNNYYEKTKHLAEVVVRERMAEGLPVTIYRPSVVAGDSRTGATQKLDGAYFVIRWILKQSGSVAVVPVLGDPTVVRFNMVPRDVVVDAVVELSGRPDTVGSCYAIADPEPMTIDELLTHIAAASGKRLVKARLPFMAAKIAMAKVPGVSSIMGMPPGAANYFVHPTHYDTRNATEALGDQNILEWDRPAWIEALVDFTSRNLSMSSDAMT